MFSGIIRHFGFVAELFSGELDLRLRIETDLPAARRALGASIACNGVCLTVAEMHSSGFSLSASAETLLRTNLGSWHVGKKIHLEPALWVGEPLDGHLVFGHVDGLSQLLAREAVGESLALHFSVPDPLAPLLAEKGSITIDGVSLTVNAVSRLSFSVMLVPHTQLWTCLGELRVGDSVHLEADMLARYVARQISYRAENS